MNITTDTTIHITPDGTERWGAAFMLKAAQYIESAGLSDWDLRIREDWDRSEKGKGRRVPIGYTLTRMTNETVGGAADVEPSNGVQRERKAAPRCADCGGALTPSDLAASAHKGCRAGDTPEQVARAARYSHGGIMPGVTVELPIPGSINLGWAQATDGERWKAWRDAGPERRAEALGSAEWGESARRAKRDYVAFLDAKIQRRRAEKAEADREAVGNADASKPVSGQPGDL